MLRPYRCWPFRRIKSFFFSFKQGFLQCGIEGHCVQRNEITGWHPGYLRAPAVVWRSRKWIEGLSDTNGIISAGMEKKKRCLKESRGSKEWGSQSKITKKQKKWKEKKQGSQTDGGLRKPGAPLTEQKGGLRAIRIIDLAQLILFITWDVRQKIKKKIAFKLIYLEKFLTTINKLV